MCLLVSSYSSKNNPAMQNSTGFFFDDHFGEWLGPKAPVHWVFEPTSLSFWKKSLSFEKKSSVLRKMLEFLKNIRWVLGFWEIIPEFCVSPGKKYLFLSDGRKNCIQKSEKNAVWVFNSLSFGATLGSKAPVRWVFGQILAWVFFSLSFFHLEFLKFCQKKACVCRLLAITRPL